MDRPGCLFTALVATIGVFKHHRASCTGNYATLSVLKPCQGLSRPDLRCAGITTEAVWSASRTRFMLLLTSLHRFVLSLKPRSITSSASVTGHSVLVRDWIEDSLYGSGHGYFNRVSSPVGQLPAPIQFQTLAGQQAYLQQLRMWYDKLKVSWLTPGEIFQPHYGQAIATAMLRNFPQDEALNVIEVGGGSGRLARDILDHLQDHQPERYEDASYTALEISPQLAATQAAKVLEGGRHTSRYQVLHQDAINSSVWDTVDTKPCIVILMEVLDNLPHDKVCRHSAESKWQETWLHSGHAAGTQAPREVMQPVSDPLIWACLQAAQQVQPDHSSSSWLHATMDYILASVSPGGDAGGQIQWLPTACLHLLHRICQARPNHLLLAADFDELPEVAVAGQGAPLVASTVNGQTSDHGSYLVPPGTADIFFPTDFKLLQHLHQLAYQGDISGQSMKTGAFMQQYADVAATRTNSGYNPLVEDFTNTSLYMGRTGACRQ